MHYLTLNNQAYFLASISSASMRFVLHFLREELLESTCILLRRLVVGQTNIRIRYNI